MSCLPPKESDGRPQEPFLSIEASFFPGAKASTTVTPVTFQSSTTGTTEDNSADFSPERFRYFPRPASPRPPAVHHHHDGIAFGRSFSHTPCPPLFFGARTFSHRTPHPSPCSTAVRSVAVPCWRAVMRRYYRSATHLAPAPPYRCTFFAPRQEQPDHTTLAPRVSLLSFFVGWLSIFKGRGSNQNGDGTRYKTSQHNKNNKQKTCRKKWKHVPR